MRDCACSGTILLEPEGKNTAPAVFAAYYVQEHIGDSLLLVMPSDHHIPDQDAFEDGATGRSAAEEGAIVTFGVAPDRPETGYGYMFGQPSTGAAFAIKNFMKSLIWWPRNRCWMLVILCGTPVFLFRSSAMLAHAKILCPIARRLRRPLMGRVRTIISGILMMWLGKGYRAISRLRHSRTYRPDCLREIF